MLFLILQWVSSGLKGRCSAGLWWTQTTGSLKSKQNPKLVRVLKILINCMKNHCVYFVKESMGLLVLLLHLYTMEHYSAIKKREIMLLFMEGPRECHTEWSKSNREREILYDILYIWTLKGNDTNELIKQKEIHRLESKLMIVGDQKVRESEKVMYTLVYLKWIANKYLLYNTWNPTQCYVPAWIRGGFGGGCLREHVWLTPFAAHLTPPPHC